MIRKRFVLALVTSGVAASLVASACSSDQAQVVVSSKDGGSDAAGDGAAVSCGAGPLLATDCDPIGGYCGFPFPSNVYLQADPTGKNPSGKTVRFGAATLPKTGGTTPVDPGLFYGLDGFSPASTLMAYLPGATATGLPTANDLAASMTSSSPTVVLDAETGALVPHFVDVDSQATDGAERSVMIHPAVLLGNGKRYIVAMRHVKDSSGSAITPTDAFKALRDGGQFPDASVDARRCLYREIFAKLARAGVKQDDLQVAWDFTVGSKEAITGPLVKVRDAALAAVGADGPDFTFKIGSVEENPNPNVLRHFTITMKMPLYMSAATYTPGATPPEPVPHLLWDDAGKPKQNGTLDVDILVTVPNSVATAEAHGLLQNGHGLFGGKSEGHNGYLAAAANGWHWIGFGVDFYGFASEDVLTAGEGLTNRPEVLPGFFDRQIQGHVNQLVAMRLMMGKVAKSGVKDDKGKVLLDPKWVNADVRAYRGDSQGGIMGGTYMTISTDVTRGYLGEFGTPYSVLLNRSVDATLYNGLLAQTYGDGRAVQLMWGLIQMHWDHTEPSGFVPFMTENRLPNTPAHHVLMHDGLGDHQVTTFGAHIMARAVGAKLLESNDPAQPVVRDVFGLTRAKAPLTDESAVVEWDFALPPEPLTNLPAAEGCDPHDRIRAIQPTYEQEDEFFRTGKIDWFCDGICNCDGPKPEKLCPETYKDQCCSKLPDGGPSTDPKCQ